jgi:hypothetical protein
VSDQASGKEIRWDVYAPDGMTTFDSADAARRKRKELFQRHPQWRPQDVWIEKVVQISGR